MASLPSFETYCPNTTGVNALVFELPSGALVYYSYRTPVAFKTHGHVVVRENDWGPTTGKHLNAIDGGSREARKKRVPREAFELMLSHLGQACNRIKDDGVFMCKADLVPLSGNVMGCPVHGIVQGVAP